MTLRYVLPLAALLAAPASVLAHTGHGAAGASHTSPASHWHATDSFGLLLVAGAAAAALWLSRGRK